MTERQVDIVVALTKLRDAQRTLVELHKDGLLDVVADQHLAMADDRMMEAERLLEHAIGLKRCDRGCRVREG